MFLICLSLVSLIAVAILGEQEFLAVEQEEFIPVPVRVKEKTFSRNPLPR